MMPFDLYPQGGSEPLGIPQNGNGTARRGYGPPTFQVSGFHCVYCGMDLGSSYSSWLSISVDHVVPRQIAWYGARREWIDDRFNLVTCCRACNEFLQLQFGEQEPHMVQEFVEIRNRIFLAKCERARERHHEERMWFETNVLHLA